jgi:hypothetical protein
MKFQPLTRRRLATYMALASTGLSSHLLKAAEQSHPAAETRNTMQLQIDHIMFPVYFNNAFLDIVEQTWKGKATGRVFSQPQNAVFKAVYLQGKSFYVEHLSTVESEPYWSNTLYIVVPKEFWSYYATPALRSEHFLMPRFGCGYSLVSPEFPHLHSSLPEQSYDGLSILISSALEAELKTLAGRAWSLPPNVRVHNGLHHAHDMVVVDGESKVVAPLYQANPLLREYL